MEITSITPRGGPAGTTITINGTSFGALQGTATLDGVTVTTVSSWSDIQIELVTPSGTQTDGTYILRLVREDLTEFTEELFWIPAIDVNNADIDYQLPNTETGLTQNVDLPRRAEAAIFNRIFDMIKSLSAPTSSSDTLVTRSYTAGVQLRDPVYQKADGSVDKADATSDSTSRVIGVVSAVDSPSAGQVTIVAQGDVSGYGGAGYTVGSVLILGTAPGSIIEKTDTGNPNYPSGAGNVIREVGIAGPGGVVFIDTEEGYLSVSQAEAEAGTSTDDKYWSPLRIAQAIAALETYKALDHTATDHAGLTGIDPVDVTQIEAEAGTETANRSWSPLRVAQAISAVSPPSGGWVHVRDITPTSGGDAVGSKVYQTAENDVLLSATSDTNNVTVWVEGSGPRVKINGSPYDLTKISGASHYESASGIPITVAGSGDITVVQVLPNGGDGATVTVALTVQLPPVIETLSFTGGYPTPPAHPAKADPIQQIHLKAGDTFQITGTTDIDINLVEIQNNGACTFASIGVAVGKSFTVTGTIADRGTSTQDLAAFVRVRSTTDSFSAIDNTNSGAGGVDGVDLVKLNNTTPTGGFGSISYPGSQQALKDSETASIVTSPTNFTYLIYDSPNSQLSVTNPTLDEANKSVQRIAGDYNITTNNFRSQLFREENGATAVAQAVVNIAHIDPVIQVTEPAARLRSGGNVGTSIQNHTITITSNQNLLSNPSLSEDTGGGTFIGSWVGGPTIYTRTLQVHDDDTKGTYNWQSLSATNLADKTVTTITGGSSYVLGGFVVREMPITAWPNREGSIGTQVSNTTKLVCENLSKGGGGPNGGTIFIYDPDLDDEVDKFTITQPSLTPNPTGNLWYNKDLNNAQSNTSGLAKVRLEETV